VLNRFNVLNDPVNAVDPWGLNRNFFPSVIGLDPSAHPVFQPGSYENQLIANDLKKILKLFDSNPDVISAIRRLQENLKLRNNEKPCPDNDPGPIKEFSQDEIAEMYKRAKMLAAKMRYQQLQREMEN